MFWRSPMSQCKGQRKEEEKEEENEEAAVSSKILSVTDQITRCHVPVIAMAKTNLTRFSNSCHDTERMGDPRGSHRCNDGSPSLLIHKRLLVSSS
jgi:hypothetical protein